MPSVRCPCNGVPPLLSGSSQVMGKMSLQIIPAGLAHYFTRNTPIVQYKLSRRAITLEGEFRKSFSKERTSWMFWIMSRRQCRGGRGLVFVFCFARLGHRTGKVTRGARSCGALNAKGHNVIHVHMTIRILDFILKAVRTTAQFISKVEPSISVTYFLNSSFLKIETQYTCTEYQNSKGPEGFRVRRLSPNPFPEPCSSPAQRQALLPLSCGSPEMCLVTPCACVENGWHRKHTLPWFFFTYYLSDYSLLAHVQLPHSF